MGYAVIMFGVLLILSVVMVTAVNYGILKDSQKAPFRAENAYADIKTGQAQTGITINDTCLSGQNGAYVGLSGGATYYTLWLTAGNNGSIVLNPNNSTVFFNSSYYSFNANTSVSSSVPFGSVWSPLINLSIGVQNIYMSNLQYPYRLMMAASNGITTIAPTTPTNFSGTYSSSSYNFTWDPSNDSTGIAYYILYNPPSNSRGVCPKTNIPSYIANATAKSAPCSSCNNLYFYVTAVNNVGNMGVQSVTLTCSVGQGCK